VQITEPPVLEVSFTAQAVKCFGENTGAAASQVNGGVSPYTYLWENGQQTANASQLSAGFAQLLLTDKNGCQLLDSVEIKQPDSLLGGTTDKRDVICFGEQDGRIYIHGAGGTPPYRFALDNKPWNGSSTQIALKAGIYVPHILDANGCTAELPAVEIEQRDPVDLDLGPDITINLGQTTQLFAQIANAYGPVIYAWSPEDSTWLSCLDCPDPLVDTLYYANSFTLHVVDSLGCEAEDRITVLVEKPRRIFVPTGFTPNGDNENDFLFVHGQKSARVLTFRVYDRWGEMLYEATDFPVNDYSTGWDGNFRGNPVDPGVYIWTLEVEYLDKTREVFKGSTNLLR
ncbi:MAG TPA: gliding motility-associated C-terminal domain-containing protein, partial [Saprospiraceae bacterium]|nr:gliding motility-associated C-terminal domain-containing protein [Saprospiraceae bacterium]